MEYLEKISSKISTIDTELAPAELPDLLKFIHQYYILSNPGLFRFGLKEQLTNRQLFRSELWILKVFVNVRATSSIQVEMRPSSGIVQQEAMKRKWRAQSKSITF